MAYIGNSPANVGNYQIVDDISSSFNGSTTSFALASGSITITPAKSGQLLVGVNGVMQEPDDTGTNGFKVSGSNVVFSSAPASGDTFWAVYQGQNVDIGTPSAGTVDTTQLADGAVTAAKIADGTVVAAEIATNAVTTVKINADAVTGAKIADDAIDSEHIAADSIDAEHYAAGSVDTTALGADAVTGAKIADNAIDSEHYVDDSIDADHLANSINTDIATGVTANTTANAALPKAGGTVTGQVKFDDSVKLKFGTGQDLEIYHDSQNAYIDDNGDGDLSIRSDGAKIVLATLAGHEGLKFITGGALSIKHNNSTKLETTANGVTITGTAIATTDTDTSNTGSVTLDFAANQNFVLTLTGNVTLANPSTEQVGQSGFITLIQDGTGSRTLAVGDQYFGAGGEVPTISTDANAIDVIPYIVIASGKILLGAAQLAFADAS
tara:strand:+ start:3744 stop:5060 length:1317 start_codon:yes stop_codon:yes gene_type:complete